MDFCSDELGINILKMRNFFKQIVNYEKLGVHAPFKKDCFGHALYKTHQYTTFDEKVSSNLQPMNIKIAHFQSTILNNMAKKLAKEG